MIWWILGVPTAGWGIFTFLKTYQGIPLWRSLCRLIGFLLVGGGLIAYSFAQTVGLACGFVGLILVELPSWARRRARPAGEVDA